MHDYEARWRLYKRFRTIYLVGSWAALVLVVAFVVKNVDLIYTNDHFTVLAFVLGAAYVVTIVLLMVPFYWFRCPCCKAFFSAKGWRNKALLAKRCVHCGLPRYANSDNEVQA
jgi:hypothetical protein